MTARRFPGGLMAAIACLHALLAWSSPGPDDQLAAYFASETASLASNLLANVESPSQWESPRAELRRQLLDMLGLWPLPRRTDLHTTITGRIEQDDLIVEKLFFESLPGLYVTANLYRPRSPAGPLPAILYACGHAPVK